VAEGDLVDEKQSKMLEVARADVDVLNPARCIGCPDALATGETESRA